MLFTISKISNGLLKNRFTPSFNNSHSLSSACAEAKIKYGFISSWFAIKENGCFVKTTRKKLVGIAGEVITHARRVEVRMMEYVYREVERIRRKMNFVIVDASRLKRGKFPGFKT